MSMRIVAFLAIATYILLASPTQMAGLESHTNIYYISPAGNDSNAGTSESPLHTIQAGVNRAYPGDLVMVLAGTYNEQVSFPRSGADGFPITVRGEVDSEGNPLAVIDNTTLVEPLWEPAPEVGSGVYKADLGYDTDLMLYNGRQILKINDRWMVGDSHSYCDKGFNILAYPADKTWEPFHQGKTVYFWDAVEVLFGVLGDTTYIRFRNGDDPDTCALRSAPVIEAVSISRDHIVLEHLQIQGSSYPVYVGGDYNIIQDNVIRNGWCNVGLVSYSAHNVVRRNDMTLGYGDYAHFGEWSAPFPGDQAQSLALYSLMKYLEGDGGTAHQCVLVCGYGAGNEVSDNKMYRGGVGVLLINAPLVTVSGNEISGMVSVGVCIHLRTEDVSVFGNAGAHCNAFFRLNRLGEYGDTKRSGFFYNNYCYNDSGAGNFITFHTSADCSTNIVNGWAKAPDFWFYHNSYAGGQYWANPPRYASSRTKVLNNIMSSQYLVGSLSEADVADPYLFAGFDYNFLGGLYYRYGYQVFAATDRHNIWATDTMKGDIDFQVWPLSPEPDWIVPDTSSAYRSGLDLSDSFQLRDSTYGPLPGMTPGYFPGDAPSLGAVQYPAHVREPQRDREQRSVTQLLELAFAPNPATCRHVMVRCAIPTQKDGKLTLRDVAGRTVMSRALQGGQQAFAFSWDCRDEAGRSVPAGVYMARLEVPGFSKTVKLVLQR